MKARFSLFEGTWRKYHGLQGADAFLDDAISAAKNVINSNEYELWDHRAELGDWSYKYFFTLSKIKSNPAGLTKADNKETISITGLSPKTKIYIIYNTSIWIVGVNPIRIIHWL